MDMAQKLKELAVLQAEAAREVAVSKEKQRLAQQDLDQAMQTVRMYQQKLQDSSVFDTKEIQNQLQEAMRETNEVDSRNREEIEAEEANKVAHEIINDKFDDSNPPFLPVIEISMEADNSLLRSDGHVHVIYAIDGLWQDNDEIRLLCASQNPEKQVNYYKSNDNAPYETVEYTVKPQLDTALGGNNYIGSVKLQLPTFGGIFRVAYIRSVRNSSGAAVSHHVIAKSDPFVVPATIRKQPNKNSTLIKCRTIYSPKNTYSKLVYRQIVEDLRSIKTILVAFKLDSQETNVHRYNRVSAWAIEASNNTLKLVIEVDVITADGLSTVFLEAALAEDPAVDINIDEINGAQVEIDDLTGRIVCRLPYNRSIDTSLLCGVVSSYTDGTEELLQQQVAMHCVFCHNCVSKMEVSCIKTLPSGVFDNMMHDFICCEDDCTSIPLTSADVTSQPSTMILGNIHVVLHPSNINPSNILLKCKKNSSVIDLVIGYGGLIATNSNKGSSNVVIDVDTCAVLCKRCQNYLGDGVINPSNSTEDVFLIDDIRDVRIGLHNVSFHWSGADKVGSISTEKCVSRLMCHLSSAYGATSFRLAIVDGTEATSSSSAIQHTHLLVRILSKDYTFSLLPSDGKAGAPHMLVPGIKVSYSLVTGAIPSHDTNIYLFQHEYSQLVQSLTSRAPMFGQGIMKNSDLSCLLI